MTEASRPVAFVTGASRGIGKAIALALADAGHDVVISARTVTPGEQRENSLTIHKSDTRPLPGSLQETAEEIEARGVQCLMVPLDLTDRATVGAAAQKVLDEWGGVDVIVHNGRFLGPGLMDVFMDIPIDAYEKFFEAHAIAPIVLTRALLPGMIERGGGTVITITSSSAFNTPPAPAGQGGWGLGYAVGKASGHPLVGTLHTEYFAKGLRAFNVQPGFVATERNHLVAASHGHEIKNGAPPSAIGAVVKWLVTAPEAKELSGEMIEAQEFVLEHNLHPDWH